MNFRILLSVVPVAVFLGLSQVAPPWVTISASFVASTLVYVATRKDRLIGVLGAFGFAVLALGAVAGLVSSNEKAYLASGPMSDFLFVGLFAGSIFVGQPLVGGVTRELVPSIAERLEPQARIFAWLSLGWAGFNLVQGLIRVYLLANMSAEEYVVWSRVAAWPLSAMMYLATAFLIYRAVTRRTQVDGAPVRI